jgi:hypothetical protein
MAAEKTRSTVVVAAPAAVIVPCATSTIGAASAVLTPNSFKEHIGRFKAENNRIRGDISRFKLTVEVRRIFLLIFQL